MQTILNFLNELKINNNRDWFNENRDQYVHAKSNFENLINRLIPAIYQFDPEIGSISAKQCVFRIFRDVRFSKDKSPYKTNMGGFIARGGRKGGYAGYYIHIDPEQSFIAGGLHMPQPDILKKARQEILYNIDEFKAILNKPSFINTFGEIQGEQLKRPPKDFPADFPDIDLLKFKGYTVIHSVENKTLLKDDFENYALHIFREMYPLNHFLNKALS
jgi:uncharacterized protein (TIGR02453 family)